MKCYEINGTLGYQRHVVIAKNVASVERLWKEEYPDCPIERIQLISDYVLVEDK